MITIPIYLQMVLEYNALEAGLSLAPLSLSMFATAIVAGRRSGNRRPASIIRAGYGLLLIGMLILLPIVPRADAGWYLAIPLADRRAPASACSSRSSTTTRSRRSRKSASAKPPA